MYIESPATAPEQKEHDLRAPILTPKPPPKKLDSEVELAISQLEEMKKLAREGRFCAGLYKDIPKGKLLGLVERVQTNYCVVGWASVLNGFTPRGGTTTSYCIRAANPTLLRALEAVRSVSITDYNDYLLGAHGDTEATRNALVKWFDESIQYLKSNG